MSLLLWLPLDGNLTNNGINEYIIKDIGVPWGGGKLGKCMDCTGNTANTKRLYINSNDFHFTGSFSWTAWIYPVHNTSYSTGNYVFTVGRVDAGSERGYGCNILSNAIRIWYNKGCWDIPVTLNTWYHIACVVNKTENKIYTYLNGSLARTISITSPPTYNDSNGLHIGAFGYKDGVIYPFFGKINDFRIYDEVLSPREIKEISKGLILHYPLNQLEKNVNVAKGNGTIKSSPEWIQINIPTASSTNQCVDTGHIYKVGYFRIGDICRVKFRLKYSNLISTSSQILMILQCYGNGTVFSDPWRDGAANGKAVSLPLGSGEFLYDSSFVISENHMKEEYWRSQLRFDNYKSGTVYIKDFKVARETADTWTPPLDASDTWRDGIEYDVSGYGHNGTYSTSSFPNISTNTPMNNMCYKFGGATRIQGELSQDVSCLKTACTFSIWANPSAQAVMPFGIASITIYFTADDNNNKLLCWNNGDGFDSPFIDSNGKSISYKLNEWHMYTVVTTASENKLYIDGIYKGKSKVYKNNFSNLIAVASWRNSTELWKFKGYLSDFRIYATALSDADVLDLYQSRLAVTNNGKLLCHSIYENIYGLYSDNLTNGSLTFAEGVACKITATIESEPSSTTGTVMKLTCTSSASGYGGPWWRYANTSEGYEVGQSYVLSMYVKSPNKKTMGLHCEDSTDDDYKKYDLSTEYKKINHVFKMSKITNNRAIVSYAVPWLEGEIVYIHSVECRRLNTDYGIKTKSTGVFHCKDINEYNTNFNIDLQDANTKELIEI